MTTDKPQQRTMNENNHITRQGPNSAGKGDPHAPKSTETASGGKQKGMSVVEAIKHLTPTERQEIIDDLAEYAAGFVRYQAELVLTNPEQFAEYDVAGLRTFIFGAAFDCVEFDAEDGYAGKFEQILDRLSTSSGCDT